MRTRHTKKVALVFPYFRTRAPTEMLFPPLGVAGMAAQLQRIGVESRIFDCTFSTSARLRRELVSYRPDIVGVYSMVSLTENAFCVADMVRSDLPGSLLVAGGPLPTVFPHRYTPRFDLVFRGEADTSFPRFCRDYFDLGLVANDLRGLLLDGYDGLFVTSQGLAIDNPPIHHGERELAHFPLPDRSHFDHARYQAEWLHTTGHKVTSIITTLGCPYACEFCSKPVFGDVFRRRSPDSIFEEIDEIQDLGYDNLWIADDSFTLDRRHLTEFCRRMSCRGLSWSCLSRADGIDEDIARLMRESGCTRVYMGLESGSDATLRLMRKHVTVAEAVLATHTYRRAGIEVAAFFIVGYPGESSASIEQTFCFALSLPFDEISFNVPVPLPGSKLYERLGRPDHGRDWKRENEVTFLYSAGLDERWLRHRIEATMTSFERRRAAHPVVSVHGPEDAIGAFLEEPQHPASVSEVASQFEL